MRRFTSRLALAALCTVPMLTIGCTNEPESSEEGADEERPVTDSEELQAAAAGKVNTSPDYLVVYDNNLENLLPPRCYVDEKLEDRIDWNRFFRYLKAQARSPDIFTVQQISNTAQLNALTARMSSELAGTYKGVIAVPQPGSMGYPSACGKLKNQQTNAVIYRTDRFTYEDSTHWRSDAPDDWKAGTGACKNLSDDRIPTSQDRAENVAVRLYDRIAKKRVSVGSIHWPTKHWNGPSCADENMKEANAALDSLGGTLKIVAGDTNATRGAKEWWKEARGFGFRDPIDETCPSSGCPDSTSTNNTSRIDFLLVKSGSRFSSVRTVSEKSAGGKYSDHLAVRANVYY